MLVDSVVGFSFCAPQVTSIERWRGKCEEWNLCDVVLRPVIEAPPKSPWSRDISDFSMNCENLQMTSVARRFEDSFETDGHVMHNDKMCNFKHTSEW